MSRTRNLDAESECGAILRGTQLLANSGNLEYEQNPSAVTLPARILPVDEQYRATDLAVPAVTTDISESGISLNSQYAVESRLLLLAVAKPESGAMQFIAELVSCEQFDGNFKVTVKLIKNL